MWQTPGQYPRTRRSGMTNKQTRADDNYGLRCEAETISVGARPLRQWGNTYGDTK
jgi:hypothetical protein